MIAAVMLYGLAVSIPLAAAGFLIDRAAALCRWPRRWIWTALIIAISGFVASAPWRIAASPVETTTPRATAVATHGGTAELIPAAATTTTQPAPPGGVGNEIGRIVDRAINSSARFDSLLGGAWLFWSAALAALYLVGQIMLARRRRAWREALVEDEPVLIAPALGPAVVGLVSPRIVLPEWALAMDAGALGLILRHEREHVRTADPWLIHLAGISLVLCPWNPIAWWMASRLRLAVEFDCDARVLGAVHAGDRQEAIAYGELLLEVASRRPAQYLFGAPALVESSSRLASRILALCPTVVKFARAKAAIATGCALASAALVVAAPLPRVTTALPAAPTDHRATQSPQEWGTSRRTGDELPAATAAKAVGRSRGGDRAAAAPAAPLDASGPDEVSPATPEMAASIVEASGRSRDPLVFAVAETEAVSEFTAAASTGGSPSAAPISSLPARTTYTTDAPRLLSPVPTMTVRPRYTSEAMEERISGRVLVQVTVGTDGRVTDAEVVKSLERGLDQNALAAAKQWMFRPGMLDDRAVPVSLVLELGYQLH